MPKNYTRKDLSRGEWTEENLRMAVEQIQNGSISQREAEKIFGIPVRTLRRRIKSGNFMKIPLGPQVSFGIENEKLFALCIRNLEDIGFSPTMYSIRTLAYKFAEKLGIPHKFSKAMKIAGPQWYEGFIRRNPEISVVAADGSERTENEAEAFMKIVHDVAELKKMSSKDNSRETIAEIQDTINDELELTDDEITIKTEIEQYDNLVVECESDTFKGIPDIKQEIIETPGISDAVSCFNTSGTSIGSNFTENSFQNQSDLSTERLYYLNKMIEERRRCEKGEFENFGKEVAEELNSLPLPIALRLRIKMLELICEAKRDAQT